MTTCPDELLLIPHDHSQSQVFLLPADLLRSYMASAMSDYALLDYALLDYALLEEVKQCGRCDYAGKTKPVQDRADHISPLQGGNLMPLD